MTISEGRLDPGRAVAGCHDPGAADCAWVAASSSAARSAASAAPIRWNISSACRSRTSACGGAAGGDGAAAQAGQRVSLVQGAADRAGQFQGLPVTPLGLREVTAHPVQRPCLVERLGLTAPVAEVAVDAQGLLQSLGRARVVTRHPPHDPELGEGVGLAEPVAEVPVDAQGLLQASGRAAG